MRNIKINQLVLENFKCHKNLPLAFNGQNVSIYGDNATGKTSVYDALTWLLFGKDSMGNGEKNIEIKPLNAAGEVENHDAITSVTAEFEIDGEIVTLKRSQREVWSTKRGSSEATYTGNVSDYFVDDVPMKKNLFDAKIKDLIPEEIFRMLTSVSYFANDLKWQNRRAVLFEMAGSMDDREIMAKAPRFAPLLEGMGKRDMHDYKAALVYERKGLTGTRDEIPARISEAQRMLQDADGVDTEGANATAESLWTTISDLNSKISALDNNTAIENKRLELREVKLNRDTLQRENDSFRQSQDDGTAERNEIRRQIDAVSRNVASLTACRNRCAQQNNAMNAQIDHLRKEWVNVNGSAFAGGVCPTCGQPLPFDQLKTKTEEFDRKKQKQLKDLESRAGELQEQVRSNTEAMNQYGSDLEKADAEEEGLRERLAQLTGCVKPKEDIEGFAEQMTAYDQQIQSLQDEIISLTSDAKTKRDSLTAQLQEANDRFRDVQGMIAKASTRDQLAQRIRELQESAKSTSEKLEAIDQMIFLMEEFVRYKAGFVEQSINDLFRVATFRLFREQANGGLEERCDVVYDGVPYSGLNNGMKINVGIDIINTLSRYYGVTVPLFVDNAEGVTKLEPCNAQTIRLVVSEEDKELRIV